MKQIISNLYAKFRSYVNPKSLLWIGLILLVVCWFTCNISQKGRTITSLTDSARYWKDRFGNEHATTQSLILDREALNEKVDSISKVLKIKPKTVIEYVRADAKIDTNLHVRVDTFWKKDTVRLADGSVRIDSSRKYNLSYRDSTFISVSGVVPESPQRLHVQANVELNFTRYWKRQHILGLAIGRKTEYTDVTTNNPYIHFTHTESYKSVPPLRVHVSTGVGPFIGINPFNSKVVFGVGIGVVVTINR